MPDMQLLWCPLAQIWHLLHLCDLQGKATQGVLQPPQRTMSRVPQLTCAVRVGFYRGLGLGSSWAKVSIHSYYLQLQMLFWNEMPEQGPLFQRLFFRPSYWFGGVIWMCCALGWQKLLDWASPVEIAGQSMEGTTIQGITHKGIDVQLE